MTQQSTVEERFNEYFYEGDRNSVMCKKHKAFATPIEIIRFANSEIQLAEQKAREEERYRIASIIDWYFEGLIIIQEPKLTKQNLINTITKE